MKKAGKKGLIQLNPVIKAMYKRNGINVEPNDETEHSISKYLEVKKENVFITCGICKEEKPIAAFGLTGNGRRLFPGQRPLQACRSSEIPYSIRWRNAQGHAGKLGIHSTFQYRLSILWYLWSDSNRKIVRQ